MTFFMSDGSTQIVSTAHFNVGTDQLFTYTTPIGGDWAGFFAYSQFGWTIYTISAVGT